ncbi:MAG: cytidine deaminase [Anaerolineae bacterium]|nr:cytidine deaminase [Anaerolineae bacterium]
MPENGKGHKATRRTQIVPSESLPDEWRELVEAALEARRHAHAPYSHFHVGAAVRAGSGRVYAGCNIENASFGLTVCAERVAIWKAVSEGERDLQALAVVTSTGATPCGACRQVMAEFGRDMAILVADAQGNAWATSLQKLLPNAFLDASLQDTEPVDQQRDA